MELRDAGPGDLEWRYARGWRVENAGGGELDSTIGKLFRIGGHRTRHDRLKRAWTASSAARGAHSEQ